MEATAIISLFSDFLLIITVFADLCIEVLFCIFSISWQGVCRSLHRRMRESSIFPMMLLAIRESRLCLRHTHVEVLHHRLTACPVFISFASPLLCTRALQFSLFPSNFRWLVLGRLNIGFVFSLPSKYSSFSLVFIRLFRIQSECIL